MDTENLIYEKRGRIAFIFLNRPNHMNSLNTALIQEFHHVLDIVEHDDSVGVFIITGKGKAFCAGADLKEVINFKKPAEMRTFLEKGQRLFNRLETMGKPVIACINGVALGGGCELALACDIRIASEEAVLGLTEVKVGLIAAGGGTTKLPRIVGITKATEMLFLGSTIRGEEACRIGLVTKVVAKEVLIEETDKMARILAYESSPMALSAIKEILKLGSAVNAQESLALEINKELLLSKTEDMKEGVKAFVQKRKPIFQGK